VYALSASMRRLGNSKVGKKARDPGGLRGLGEALVGAVQGEVRERPEGLPIGG